MGSIDYRPKPRNTLDLKSIALWQHQVASQKAPVPPSRTDRPNPLVVGDLVIVSLFSERVVYAVSRNEGAFAWTLPLPTYGHPDLLVRDDLLYATSSNTMYALNHETGEVIWHFAPVPGKGETIYASPVISGDQLYLGDRAGYFHCLNIRTGATVWKVLAAPEAGWNVNATPVVHNGVVYTANNGGTADAFDCRDGKRLWSVGLDGPTSSQLFVHHNLLVVLTRRSITMFDTATGKEIKKLTGREFWHMVPLGDDLIVLERDPFNDRLGEAYYRANGNAVYRLLNQNGFKSTMACNDLTASFRWSSETDLLYEAAVGGLAIYEPNEGICLHHMKARTGLPEVCDGMMYLLADDGCLYAINHPLRPLVFGDQA